MKNNKILLIHNGNNKVKPTIASLLRLPIVDTIANLHSLESKLEFVNSNNSFVTDVTCADNINDFELFELKNHCKIIKIFTNYDDDIKNLESVHGIENYDKIQWYRSLSHKLWAADEIITWQNFKHELCVNKNHNVTFTCARTGTHILANIVKTFGENFMHHDNDIISSKRFDHLINSEKIYSVIRTEFYDLLASKAVGKQLGFAMVTTKNNYSKNVEICKKLSSRKIERAEADEFLNDFINFADLLLLAATVFNKKIMLTKFEFLSPYFNKLPVLKNPYNAKQLILNQDELTKMIYKIHDPIYQTVSNQLVKYCGLCLL
jgi:uncharacterized protein YkvS